MANDAELEGSYDSKDDSSLLEFIQSELKSARSAQGDWHKNAIEDYEFFAGHQWSDTDQGILDGQGRPPVTFNRILRTVNAVTGLEIQNRQEVTYIPRQEGDAPLDSLFTEAARWVRDSCDAEDEESEAFQDATICGIGWVNTRVEYEEDEEGRIIIERVDPMEMLVDPRAKKRNFDDARWVARVQRWSKPDIKLQWPNYDAGNSDSSFFNDPQDTARNYPVDMDYHNTKSPTEISHKGVEVIEFQLYKKYCIYRVAATDAMGQPQGMHDMTHDDFTAFSENATASGVTFEHAKIPKRQYRRVFITGSQILENLDCPVQKFTYRAITGFRDSTNHTFFGIVSLMKDPQRWANKWLSQIMHIINSGAKNGYLYEEGAIADQREFEDEVAKPGSNTKLTNGALAEGRIQPKRAPEYPQGVDRLLQYALESINDVPGVNMEIMGIDNKDVPATVAIQRKASGITVLAPLFDSLRRYRKENGRVLAEFMQKYIADGRLIRIVGQKGAQYVPLFKDKTALIYDVIIDDAPTSPNMKNQVFAILGQMLPMLMSAGLPVPPEVLDYMPIPTALATQWKVLLAQNKADPDKQKLQQIHMMLEQIRVEGELAKADETRSKAMLNQAQAQQASATAQNETALAMQKTGAGQSEVMQEASQKDQQFILDNVRKDLELFAKIKRQKIESDFKMKNGE